MRFYYTSVLEFLFHNVLAIVALRVRLGMGNFKGRAR